MASIKKKVEQLSKDNLFKKQFDKKTGGRQPLPSQLQQKAQSRVTFEQNIRNFVRTVPFSAGGKSVPSPAGMPGGYLDFSFVTLGTGLDDGVYTVALDGSDIYAAGHFTMYDNYYYNYIAKFSSDGTISTFNSGSDSFNNFFRAIVVQTDGRVVVGGQFTSYSGSSQNRIARLNTDGTLDNTFNIGTGFDDKVRALALQSDGKIVVGGDFYNYSGSYASGIIRLNSNGTIDDTFISSSGFDHSVNGSVWALQLQSDGKILVGGEFTSYSGSTHNRIIRLDNSGSVDNTFCINTGDGFDDRVQTIDVYSNGKIATGGHFTTYSGSTANYIALLNSDGTPDATFNSGTGFDTWVNVVKFQNASKIYVGGQFSEYSGSAVQGDIARINTDGTLDPTFAVSGSGFDNYINTIAIQEDGKLVVGGWFVQYNGDNTVRFLTRIYG